MYLTKACLLSSFVLASLCVTGPVIATGNPEKPNVVVLMVDNLGWGELGVYGGGELRGAATSRLDKLASEGMLLQNFIVEPPEIDFQAGRILDAVDDLKIRDNTLVI